MMTTATTNSKQQPKEGNITIPILTSLLAYPTFYSLEKQDQQAMTSLSLFIQAIAISTIVAIITVSISSSSLKNKEVDKFFYVFSYFAFTSMISLILSCTALNNQFIISWGNFYLSKEGEPYLASTFGAVANMWDGCVHYTLYIYMARQLSAQKPIGYPGFFWLGSVVNSLLVFLPGNVIGSYGDSITLSYLLNFPIVVSPLVFGVTRLFREANAAAKNENTRKSRSILVKAVDAILLIFSTFVITLMIFRAMIVLGCPGERCKWWAEHVEPNMMNLSGYPKMQVLVHAFYFVPFYVIVALQAIWPNIGDCLMFPQWSAIFFGASLNGQWSYVLCALFEVTSTPSTYPDGKFTAIPSEGQLIFWVVNAILCIVPCTVFLRQFLSKSKQKVS